MIHNNIIKINIAQIRFFMFLISSLKPFHDIKIVILLQQPQR